MTLAVWVALAFAVALVAASTAWAAIRALRTWRSIRSLMRRTTAALDAVSQAAAAAEAHAVSLADGTERFTRATARLESWLAQLAVLQAAAAEARETLDVRRAFPRK